MRHFSFPYEEATQIQLKNAKALIVCEVFLSEPKPVLFLGPTVRLLQNLSCPWISSNSVERCKHSVISSGALC